MIVPTGDPAWVKSSTHETYGGHEDKEDYQAQGVTNPLTDVSAAQFTRAMADLAAAVRTAAFACLRITMNDTATNPPTIEVVDQMTGNRIVSYEGNSAPTGFPSGTRNGDGDITMQWDASYADEYSVSAALAIRHVFVSVESGVARIPNWEIVDDRTVRVRVFDTSNNPVLDHTICLEVVT